MDPPTRGQPLIRDTLHGTISILLVLFNLPPKDSLSIKDKVFAPKVSLFEGSTVRNNYKVHVQIGEITQWLVRV